MAFSVSGTSAAVFTCLWIFVLTDKGQQQITEKTGDNVTLPCVNKSVGDIELLEWRRRDLNVFVWKHGNMSEDDQHESFKNRLELKDSQIKDGNFSVILKNVNMKDTGTYECRVRNDKQPPPPQLICTITLTVTDSGGGAGRTGDGGDKDGGDKDGGKKDGGDKHVRDKEEGNKGGQNKNGGNKGGHVGLIVGLLITVVLLIVGIFIILIKCKWHLRKTSYFPPLDEEADHEPS
ncbi:hypothetical protein Q5P01_000106 [Channa striata]|uniref:Ig-like domain-containing protein n=1 Tax=Channa striata TaxID=64152 RepID=A0AA88IY61_CHASR|nr:hypothetical protein Q5P01_000106 [Channa striata]